MRTIRLTLWGAVAIALLGLAWLATRPASPPTIVENGGAVAIGGPFTLTGADGRPFASDTLKGRPSAIFFGFTHCPDVCPTTLARLTRLRRGLGKGDEAMNIVFITVDPERDGPKQVGAYSALFGTPVIGLTGSPGEIESVKKSFGVYSEKSPMPGDDYGVMHTATVFLMDRDGTFQSTIAADESDSTALAKLKRLTA